LAAFEFIDTNVTIGRPRAPKYVIAADPLAMRSDLAEVGITGGFVRHIWSAEWHPSHGNPEIVNALRGLSGFEPVWAVMPHWTGEFPPPDKVASDIAAHGIRAVTMFPAMQAYPVRKSVTGPLFEMLAARRLLLFAPFPEFGLATIETVASDFPSLNIILSDIAYTIGRELYPLLAARPNVFIETSGFMLHKGIEDAVAKLGDTRLIFGSRYPVLNPGCAVAAIMYAPISDRAKAAIASGNLKRLLAEVKSQ